jgi:hypothetical protein
MIPWFGRSQNWRREREKKAKQASKELYETSPDHQV